MTRLIPYGGMVCWSPLGLIEIRANSSEQGGQPWVRGYPLAWDRVRRHGSVGVYVRWRDLQPTYWPEEGE